MKKMIAAGLLAIGCLAASEQQASAWLNSKFSVGLNWDLQSANNSVLWGMWRNGQIPAPGPDAGMYGPPQSQRFPAPPYPPYGYMPHGYAPQGYPPQAYMPPAYSPPARTPSFQGGAAEPNYNQAQYAVQGYDSLYHFANYPRPVYYYPMTYYYP
jgi:hypothetical protein